MEARLAPICLALLLQLSPGIAWGAPASKSKLAAQGKAILQEKCGRCHAIGRTGASPLPLAPPMREIYARFLPRELQAELSEGMVSRHKEMPQIEFSDEDVYAILTYLHALSIRR
jgi:mono/diheme cytochrome c family protein